MTKQEYNTRRDACAWITVNERPESIARIMDGKGIICPMLAGRLYVNGILSRMVRTGETRNRIEALEKVENGQVESRYTTAPTINKTARAVARLNKMTGTSYTRIAKDGTREIIEHTKDAKRAHIATIGVGRFYGSIYVELETMQNIDAMQAYNDNEIEIARARAEDIAREYIREYMQGLSVKARATVRAIVALDGLAVDTRDTMRDKIMYLYRDFPAREQVSAREYNRLLKAYALAS